MKKETRCYLLQLTLAISFFHHILAPHREGDPPYLMDMTCNIEDVGKTLSRICKSVQIDQISQLHPCFLLSILYYSLWRWHNQA